MIVEVNTQTLGHILIQYSALLSFLGFAIYEGLFRRRLRPLSTLWTLICAGQLIKCSNKFFALEACRTSDPGYVTCLGGGYVASGATRWRRSGAGSTPFARCGRARIWPQNPMAPAAGGQVPPSRWPTPI